MTRLDAVNFISMASPRRRDGRRNGRWSVPTTSSRTKARRNRSGRRSRTGAAIRNALTNYCFNLTKGGDGKIDPLIGRDLEIERTIQILCRRTKNNPAVCGRSGSRQNRDRGGSGEADR